jgi:hypothetical protein
MKRYAWLSLVLLAVCAMTGCVERRFVVYSDPPGALVYVNDQYVGATPVDYYYVYHGKYHIRLVKEGYETLDVVQDIPAHWWELPGPDFVVENINPFKIRDVRNFCYTLQAMQAVRADDLVNRANEMRTRGQGIGAPREPRPVPTGPPAVVPPPMPPAGPAPAVPSLGPPQP